MQLGLNLGVDLFMLDQRLAPGGQLIREHRTGRFSAARFYLKRWLRTLPAFYAVLLVLCFGALSDVRGAAVAPPLYQQSSYALASKNQFQPSAER